MDFSGQDEKIRKLARPCPHDSDVCHCGFPSCISARYEALRELERAEELNQRDSVEVSPRRKGW